jgi:hypothetical protein
LGKRLDECNTLLVAVATNTTTTLAAAAAAITQFISSYPSRSGVEASTERSVALG